MRTLNLIAVGVVAATCLFSLSPAQAIENVRGKQYHLTAKHGPWMVMVTSFRNVYDEKQRTEGLSAEQAAAELVFELRQLGIPAYTFSQDAIRGEIDTHDRLGRDDRRIYAAQRDMICVLAGNYESVEDKVGQKTLKYIKRIHPKFLKDTKSGAIMRAESADHGPLAGAFMTINPLLKPEEVVQRNVDKEVKYLNTGIAFPLVKNPHKYTVRIATFSGKSATPLGNSSFRGRENTFDTSLQNPHGYHILRAGEDAEELTAFLRREKATVPGGVDEAYSYHDKFQSIVTVGGFDSPDDPRIQLVCQYYGPKLVPDLRLLNSMFRSRDPEQEATPDEIAKLPQVLTTHTEQLFAPGANRRISTPMQVWTFDTKPTVIAVPRIK